MSSRTFKTKHSLQERQDAVIRMLVSRPGHIPIICEKATRSNIDSMIKTKFLMSPLAPVAQLIWLIRCRIKLSKTQALFVFVDEILVPTSAEMGQIYREHKDEDGFLYVTYASEETFG